MENDPNKNINKNESKGKRLFKKAIRRNSKTSNNSQNSSLGGSSGVSRSKSYEKKLETLEANGNGPLPKPDGCNESKELAGKSKQDDKTIHQSQKIPNIDSKIGKSLDIHEDRNEVLEISPSASKKSSKLLASPKLVIKDQSDADGVKRHLKRKLDEETRAGTSGASTGTDTDADDKDPSKVKKKKNRCAVCGKKVGLTGFECRCGGLFCAVHRYSDKHDCSFDYKEMGAQEIRRNNPVVVSQKIDKI